MRLTVLVAVGLVLGGEGPAQASCDVPPTVAERRANERAEFRASHVAFEAVTLPRRTGRRFGELLSPARMRVLRYLKGGGPRVVRVRTPEDPRGYTEDLIEPRTGEVWLVYARRTRSGILETQSCSASRPLRAPTAAARRARARDAQS